MESQVRFAGAGLAAAGRPVSVGGFLPKSEAEQAIADCDWLLIPSRIESIPVVFSDAMKIGRPVVAMPVGDLPRLVGEGGVGIVSQAVDPVAYAQAIRAALMAQAGSFCKAIEAAASPFDLERVTVQRPIEFSQPAGQLEGSRQEGS